MSGVPTAPADRAGDEQWMSSAQVAARIGRHEVTVKRYSRPDYAHRAGRSRLHGHHSTGGTRGGRWSYRAAAVDVFVQGGSEAAQRAACGCDRLTPPAAVPRPRGGVDRPRLRVAPTRP